MTTCANVKRGAACDLPLSSGSSCMSAQEYECSPMPPDPTLWLIQDLGSIAASCSWGRNSVAHLAKDEFLSERVVLSCHHAEGGYTFDQRTSEASTARMGGGTWSAVMPHL